MFRRKIHDIYTTYKDDALKKIKIRNLIYFKLNDHINNEKHSTVMR